MAESLRDQLLKSGLVNQLREEKRPPSKGGKPFRDNRKQGGPSPAKKDQGEIDLAKAYAIRAQTEAQERKQAEQEAAEQARLRRERKQKLQQLLAGKALNKSDVEQMRHFEYGGKIRRVHVDAEQLAALNAGELGVVQQGGRYLLVGREVAEQVREIAPEYLALLAAPGADGVSDDGVPDDLVW